MLHKVIQLEEQIKNVPDTRKGIDIKELKLSLLRLVQEIKLEIQNK